MKIKKVKKMTIEDLALMVAKGFDGVEVRFDAVEVRFDGVATRFESVATKEDMNMVIGRLDRIEHLLIRALDNRVTKLEDDSRVVKTTLEKMSRV